jgi:hypothetical protein
VPPLFPNCAGALETATPSAARGTGMIKYEQRSTRAGKTYVAVRYALRLPGRAHVFFVTVGCIREIANNRFAYFEPESNDLNALLTADDMDFLKKQIEAHFDSEGPR